MMAAWAVLLVLASPAGGNTLVSVSHPGEETLSSDQSEATSLLLKMTDRMACNEVMGCPLDRAVVALGSRAVQPVIARFQELSAPKHQKFYRFHLLDLLGEIGDPEAVPFLLSLVQDEKAHFMVRERAARALGVMQADGVRETLEDLLGRTSATVWHGLTYSLAYATMRLGRADSSKTLVAALEPKAVESTNPGFSRVATWAVGQLGLKEACPGLESVMMHPERFLAIEALSSLRQLRCAGEIVKKNLARLAESRDPGMRKAVILTVDVLFPEDQDLTEVLLALLEGPFDSVREDAAQVLSRRAARPIHTREDWMKVEKER